jgi:hypothetical protein
MAPETTIAERDLEAFLEAVGGDYVAAYDKIVAEEDRKALQAKPRSNAELRKAAYAKAVKTMDRKQLASMNKTVRGFLPLAKANSLITATTGVLDEKEAEDLMVEVLEVKRLQEIAKSRYEEIRKRVFNSMTEGLAEQGEEFPEHVCSYIEVPKLGLKFTRERAGRKDPELDEAKLEELVGPEVWEKVTTVEVIPAQEVRTVDMDLFLQLARRKPRLLEELRKALRVGEFNSPAFYQRAMEPEE